MRMRTWLARWESLLLLVLVITFAGGVQTSKYFLTASNLSIALAGVTPAALITLSMTLIIITGEIDISVGSIVGLCAASMGACLERNFPIESAILAGLLVGTLAGLMNGIIIVYGQLPSLVVTVGTLALYRGIAQIVLEERGVNKFPEWYQNIGYGTIGASPVPWSSIVFTVFFVGFAIFLHATHRGRALYAIGNNREAARFSGINVKGSILGVFVCSGVMSAVAAVVLTAYLASARSDTAVGLELPVITAVVLGGVDIFGGSGTMVGVLLALLVLAFVQNVLGLAGVKPEEQQVVTGAVLILTLICFGTSAAINKARASLARHARARRGRDQPSTP